MHDIKVNDVNQIDEKERITPAIGSACAKDKPQLQEEIFRKILGSSRSSATSA